MSSASTHYRVPSLRISVVIPVYNAEEFVTQAVESALEQPQTGEVLLVEDGSSDESLSVCEKLAAAYENVRLFRHRGGENRGAAASRNLGIRRARFRFIAFLDADDFYLPGRFTVAEQILAAQEEVDGVYEAIGCHFETEADEALWDSLGHSKLTTVRDGIDPEDLFKELSPLGRGGHCHLNGLTVRKDVAEKAGFLAEELVFGEDVSWVLRLAAVGRLQPGCIDRPVAMRRVHAGNRITQLRDGERIWKIRLSMWLSLLDWMRANRDVADDHKRELVLRRILSDVHVSVPKGESTLRMRLSASKRYLVILARRPSLLWDRIFVRGTIRSLVRCQR